MTTLPFFGVGIGSLARCKRVSALFFPLVLGCAQGAAETAHEAMFHDDAAHHGVFAASAPKQLKLRWEFATAEAIVSSPTVVAGVLYVGSADNHLYALDATSGKLKWKFATKGNVNSTPAVGGGMVYAVSGDGNLYAVDAASGVQKWSFSTEGERRFSAAGVGYLQPSTEVMPDPWDLYLSSPTVVDGVVYFGSGDHHLYAVDAGTGKLKWKYQTGDVVHSTPAVAGGLVYVGSFDTFLYAVKAATGELAWKFKTGDDATGHLMTGIPGSPCVGNGTVYFGCRDANVYALDAANGAVRWKFSTGQSWVIATPSIEGNRLYFTTSDTHKFEALDAGTGKELYSLPYHIFSFSSPALAGDRAFFGSFEGTLYAVDLKNQAYAGTYSVPGHDQNAARYLDEKGDVKNEAVWTGETLDDIIVDLHVKLFSLGCILSSPFVADGLVYFTSVDGHVYALGD